MVINPKKNIRQAINTMVNATIKPMRKCGGARWQHRCRVRFMIFSRQNCRETLFGSHLLYLLGNQIFVSIEMCILFVRRCLFGDIHNTALRSTLTTIQSSVSKQPWRWKNTSYPYAPHASTTTHPSSPKMKPPKPTRIYSTTLPGKRLPKSIDG